MILFEHDSPVYHSVDEDFNRMIDCAVNGKNVYAALGPIYKTDPAKSVVDPFILSAKNSFYKSLSDDLLFPADAYERIKSIRNSAIDRSSLNFQEINEWTRAGLFLHIASKYGVKIAKYGMIHPKWNLNATETTRFGVETVKIKDRSINLLSLNDDIRNHIIPSDSIREIAVLDFIAIDFCSIEVLFGIKRETFDPYESIAIKLNCERKEAKVAFLSWCYGSTAIEQNKRLILEKSFPSIAEEIKKNEHGFVARLVQTASASIFRTALSSILPKVYNSIDFIPMFTVHDEIVLDISPRAIDMGLLDDIKSTIENAVNIKSNYQYCIRISTGYTYGEAKNG